MAFAIHENTLLEPNGSTFDFNIQFERLFFSILPSVVFILAGLWRTLLRAKKPIIVHAPIFQLLKLGAIAIYAVLELALLVLVSVSSPRVSSIFLASSVLRVAAVIMMILLSYIDHSRSPKPSVLLNSYLSLTLLLDAAQARTLFLSSTEKSELNYSSIFAATVAVKTVILLLEAKQKSSWIGWNEKEHSPEETSGIFSIGVFFWLNKIFRLGYSRVLGIDDLYPLDSALDAASLHAKLVKTTQSARLKGRKIGLVRALAHALWLPLLLPILPRLALLGFTICQPLFMEKLLDYLSQTEYDHNFGYGFIGASLLIYAGIAISKAIYWYFHNRARTMLRSILVTAIFAKATEARIGRADDGAALTLMSTDIERLRVGFYGLHEIWASVIQAALAAGLLYTRIGVVFVAPIAVVFVGFFLLAILMNFTSDSQKAWMAGVQKRVGLTATVVANMKNLKLSGLSSPVGSFVQKLRVDELASGARFRAIFIAAAALGFASQLLGPPLAFAFARSQLDASTVFTSLAYISLLTVPLSSIFEGVPQLISALACLSRIEAFLECENREDFRKTGAAMGMGSEKAALGDSAIVIRDASFGWEVNKFALNDVNVQLPTGALTMVIGSVGSGKSTLCKALLGEIPFSKGSITLHCDISQVGYCDQTAFLSNGSIRGNIVGFMPFDSERYLECISAAVLDVDFAILPQGDLTNVGSDGITLSGGQKQRVSLARALYLQTDLLLLDDIFSGLDAETEKKVFERVFGPAGLLKRRAATAVLCTHSIKHLPTADYILALGDGAVLEQGSFNHLMQGQGYVRRLGLKSAPDTPSVESTPEEAKLPIHLTTLKAQSLSSTEDEKARQVGDKTVYKHYAQSLGWVLVSLSLFFSACWGFFTNFPTIWLTYWVNDMASEHPKHTYGYYAGLYALLQCCAFASLFLLAYVLWILGIQKAGANIHKDALKTLMHAPLRFFTNTDTGVITNLFSQDLNLIDTELPESTLNLLFSLFQAIGQSAVMLVSSAYLAIAYPFLAAILYLIGRFYLRTSRQLRLLDLETKSPLYTHFLDTVKGITTLRAFGFIREDVQKNTQLINTSQRPAYLLLMIQEWLILNLNLIVMVVAVILVALSVQLRSQSAFAGAALYSLITLGENLAGIVLYYTRVETSIGAIARIKTFNESVKSENKEEEDIVPPEQWPYKGVVEFKGLSAGYNVEDASSDLSSLALRNIHLRIASGEKIAICGRTGSGKSSLVALILKLLDPTSSTAANASIDEIPLNRVDRSALRQRIIAVPQEAVFMPDGTTFRTNLDPSDVSTPEECKAVLMAVGMWDFVVERGGMDAGMSAGTLSAGQRQLMSVGRALLRLRIRARHVERAGGSSTGGILLLDEVSSSVDFETERVIQQIISTEFREYTVVAVSHRLDMIMDYDRVVVMDAGEIVEVGNPLALAGEARTRFGELVRAAKKEGAS